MMPLFPPAAAGGGVTIYTKTLQTEHAANLTGNGTYQSIAAIPVPAGTYVAIGLALLEDSTTVVESNLNIFAINTEWGVTGDDTDAFAETTCYSGGGMGSVADIPIMLISGEIVLAAPATLYFIWQGVDAVAGLPAINQIAWHAYPSSQLILIKTA